MLFRVDRLGRTIGDVVSLPVYNYGTLFLTFHDTDTNQHVCHKLVFNCVSFSQPLNWTVELGSLTRSKFPFGDIDYCARATGMSPLV